MSEFKYACPVCGQHIKCDSSQAGTVMDCPTCFQKIVVPQPPANADPKFILTGTQFVEKKIPDTIARAAAGLSSAPEKKSPVAAVLFVMVLLAAGAGAFFYFNYRHGGLPASFKGWRAGDIGDAAPAGSLAESKGICTLAGSGADIWRQADAFYFVFRPLTNDGSLVAEILNVQDTHMWAKAGPMIRESTNASSVFALSSIRADGQAQFIWRNATHGEAAASGLFGGAGYPKWVKIMRQGNRFTAFVRTNSADDWQRVGETQTIRMPSHALVGLAVCSHNAGTMCEAQFGGIALTVEPKSAPEPATPKPPPPPANETNWTLTLATNAIPDAPAAGRIHTQDFVVERATFQNGSLGIRQGRGEAEFGLTINFAGAQPEAMSGKTINITTNVEKAARVTFHWHDADGKTQRENFQDGYALRLEFGELTNNRLPGKIYLCVPDDGKSYLMGSFNADARKPKPKPPQPSSGSLPPTPSSPPR